jgi:hypothetical protein
MSENYVALLQLQSKSLRSAPASDRKIVHMHDFSVGNESRAGPRNMNMHHQRLERQHLAGS